MFHVQFQEHLSVRMSSWDGTGREEKLMSGSVNPDWQKDLKDQRHRGRQGQRTSHQWDQNRDADSVMGMRQAFPTTGRGNASTRRQKFWNTTWLQQHQKRVYGPQKNRKEEKTLSPLRVQDPPPTPPSLCCWANYWAQVCGPSTQIPFPAPLLPPSWGAERRTSPLRKERQGFLCWRCFPHWFNLRSTLD